MSLNVCAYVAGEESRDATEKRIRKQDGGNIGKFEDAIIGRISESSNMYIFHNALSINDALSFALLLCIIHMFLYA